jgi:hypothetical protein
MIQLAHDHDLAEHPALATDQCAAPGLPCCCPLSCAADQQAIDVLQAAYGPGYKVVGVPGGTREVLLNAGEPGCVVSARCSTTAVPDAVTAVMWDYCNHLANRAEL